MRVLLQITGASRFWKTLRIYALAFGLPILVGCSSSIFTGDKSHDQKTSSESKVTVNENCRELDLSNAALDAPNFRRLTHCLNANGSISAYQALVDRASDAQLSAILDVFNQELLLNKRRWKDVSDSFRQAEGSGLLDRVFRQAGELLSHPKFGVNLVRVLHQAASENGKIRPEVLGSIHLIAEEMLGGKKARENSRAVIENLLRTMKLKSYGSLAGSLRLPVKLGRPALGLLSRQALQYFQDKASGERDYLKTLLWGIADGSMLTALDQFYFGASNLPVAAKARETALASMDSQLQALEYFVFYMTSQHKDDVLGEATRLFQLMDNSIQCMDNAAEIPNGNMYVLDELAKIEPSRAPYWLLRSNLLKLKFASGVCEYPEHFAELLGVLRKMAAPGGSLQDQAMLPTVARLIRALGVGEKTAPDYEAYNDLREGFFYQKTGKDGRTRKFSYPASERYRRLVAAWIGDQSRINAYTNLADLAAELSRPDRRALSNLLYLLDGQNRDQLQYALRFLLRPRLELRSGTAGRSGGWLSIYDALTRGIGQINPDTFAAMFEGLSEFFDSDQEVALPALSTIREAMLFNDVNPILDFALEVGVRAERRAPFFNAVFDLVETAEFEDALKLTAKLSKNGQLKEILSTMLTVLKGTTQGIAGTPRMALKLDQPSFKFERDRDSLKAKPWLPVQAFWPKDLRGVNACSQLDLSVAMTATSDFRWSGELTKFGACVNSDGSFGALEQFIRYATGTKNVKDGKSLARFGADLVRDLVVTSNADLHRQYMAQISSLLIDSENHQDIRDLQSGLRFYIDKAYGGLTFSQAFGRVLGMLPEFEPLKQKVQTLLNFGATLVSDRNFPRAASLAFDSAALSRWTQKPFDPERPGFNPALMAELTAAIKQYESPLAEEDQLLSDSKVKLWQYYNQQLSQQQRYSYSVAEFKAGLKPMLDHLANSRNALFEHALTFFYTLDSDPYDPKWLEGWVHRRAGTVRAIPYYYPGQYPGRDRPTVRVVNQLDMLELIVTDADFSLGELGQILGEQMGEKDPTVNFAIKYLSKLAQSGNNLQGWIEDLHKDLDHYYDMFFGPREGYGGKLLDITQKALVQKELKRRVFNLKQVSSVVSDLVKIESVVSHPVTGRKLARNDLGLLRDFFAAILSATPPHERAVYTRDVNSLSFVASMVGFGVLRNISLEAWEFKDGEPHPVKVAHIFKFMRDAALETRGGTEHRLNQDTIAILDHLLRKDASNLSSNNFNERYVTLGRLIDRIFEWTKSDLSSSPIVPEPRQRTMALFKASLYDLSRIYEQMDLVGAKIGKDVTSLFVQAVRPWIGTAKGTGFIRDNLDLLEPVLTDASNFGMLEKLLAASVRQSSRAGRSYRDDFAFVDFVELVNLALSGLAEKRGALSSTALDVIDHLYRDRAGRMQALNKVWRAMERDPEYLAFQQKTLNRVGGRFLNWMVNASQSHPLVPKIQAYAAAHLRNGDVLALLDFVGTESQKQSDNFFKMTRFMGQPYYVSALRDALESFRESISPVR